MKEKATPSNKETFTQEVCKCCEALGTADAVRWLAEQDQKKELRKRNKDKNLKKSCNKKTQ